MVTRHAGAMPLRGGRAPIRGSPTVLNWSPRTAPTTVRCTGTEGSRAASTVGETVYGESSFHAYWPASRSRSGRYRITVPVSASTQT
jgi:hypothetical protein